MGGYRERKRCDCAIQLLPDRKCGGDGVRVNVVGGYYIQTKGVPRVGTLLFTTIIMSTINETLLLSHLSLPTEYCPSPSTDPIEFLKIHLRQLSPHFLVQFSSITTPKQRTSITAIRNRRSKYTASNPRELSYEIAQEKWPKLAQNFGQANPNLSRTIPVEVGRDEKIWAERGFLDGEKQHVGKLGGLLGGYAEEREAERMRAERRERAAREAEEFIPEEDSESDEDEDDAMDVTTTQDPGPSPFEEKIYFERLIKEKFIYGLLDVRPLHKLCSRILMYSMIGSGL